VHCFACSTLPHHKIDRFHAHHAFGWVGGAGGGGAGGGGAGGGGVVTLDRAFGAASSVRAVRAPFDACAMAVAPHANGFIRLVSVERALLKERCGTLLVSVLDPRAREACVGTRGLRVAGRVSTGLAVRAAHLAVIVSGPLRRAK